MNGPEARMDFFGKHFQWKSYLGLGNHKCPTRVLDLEKMSMTVTTLCAISLTGTYVILRTVLKKWE